uniref:GRAS domain-containing protein n=1 Tax=Steinernema glaseri TaxID=37863 RepID=A0A1I8AML5_9BILA
MDRVPFAFCDLLCDLLTINELSSAKELSGRYGGLARYAFEHRTSYVAHVMYGVEYGESMIYDCNDRKLKTLKEIEAVPKKFVRNVFVNFMDAKDEKVSQELVRRFPYAQYNFTHHSSSINEAWVDLACSLKRLGTVSIMTELNDDALQIFQKLVDSHKLSTFIMHPEAFEGGTMELSKSLLLQDQFKELIFYNEFCTPRIGDVPCDGSLVYDLLEFWSANVEELRGKSLLFNCYFQSGVERLIEYVVQRTLATVPPKSLLLPRATLLENTVLGAEWALQVCSIGECDFIKKEYNYSLCFFEEPSCFYKFEEGEEGNERRFYVSFECEMGKQISARKMPPRYGGCNDLSLMLDTPFLHVLFA